MNTIYAGIGTDLYKKLDELRKEQGYLKGELDKVSVDNVYFVDPGIPEYVTGINHIERVTIEDFIRDMLLRDFTFFLHAVIESDRMIEHIDIETLSLITLPMLVKLAIKCNTCVKLTYPSIKKVIEKYDVLGLNDSHEMLFEHELINIETIAFGEHKTILDYNRIENILRKLGLYERLKLEHQSKSIDKKEFYERLIIKQANDNDMSKIEANEFAFTTLTNIDDVPGMQDINIKELPFKLSNYILYELAKGGKFNKTPLNFYLRYLEADKLYLLTKNGYTKEVSGDMLDKDVLENIMTREGHFRTTTPPSIQLLNEIDPLYGYYSFSFTI
jgi:hypothetical protein